MEDRARLARSFGIKNGLLAALYLSNSVPMASRAPQAKKSTISAVSTMLAMNRFHIRTSANWRCDRHLGPIWQPADAKTHPQALMSNSACFKANARKAAA